MSLFNSVINNVKFFTITAMVTVVSVIGANPLMTELEEKTNAVAIPTIKKFSCYPSIEIAWQDKFMGNTGYIDGISAADLKGNPIGCGTDPLGRLFITIRYVCRQLIGGDRIQHDSGVVTYFKRTNHPDSPVVVADNFMSKMCHSLGPIEPGSKGFLENLWKFVNGGVIKDYQGGYPTELQRYGSSPYSSADELRVCHSSKNSDRGKQVEVDNPEEL